MKILGIETSCDETAAAVAVGNNESVKIISNVISSQINIHKKYGGVVPEVAAREHVPNILPVINEALINANIPPFTNGKRPKAGGIDAIAVAVGPGLVTSLLVGAETAKTLSMAWNIPVIPVQHIEGHIYANFIGSDKDIKYPAVILTVSGGHTLLINMKGHKQLDTIGETRDDAAGEAFDKAAKMLGLEYPGGPVIATKAAELKTANRESRINLPRPMLGSPDLDFSFSGLKTALLYALQKDTDWKNKIPEYAYEFQQAIIDVLIAKTIKATKDHKAKTVMLTGGVAANLELREQLKNKVKSELNLDLIIPDLKYTTDNAAMIASAGYFKAKNNKHIDWRDLTIDCNLSL